MKKKIVIIIAIVLTIVVAVVIGFCAFNGVFNGENAKAKAAYASEVARISTEQKELQSLIDNYQAKLDSGDKAYDEATENGLRSEITNARAIIKDVPQCPTSTEKINEVVNTVLSKISYTDETTKLEEVGNAYDSSVKQMKQVTNPSEEFVIERTKDIEGIIGYEAVTEDNDPNGNLNKPGGYTATIYYRYDKVSEDDVFGDSIVDIGTSGGASVEVYSTEDDANSRNEYLSHFDGGVLSSGSHTVVGTVVVRTSDVLTATEQNELSQTIVNNLLELK